MVTIKEKAGWVRSEIMAKYGNSEADWLYILGPS